MPNSHSFVQQINELLENLNRDPSAKNGVELANEILKLLGSVETKSAEEVFESSLELPNAERYDRWFQPHPIFKSDRACFELAESDLLQAKFYWLQKHTRQIIAGGVHFTPNFEDEEFTHNERYKVGVDFFLSPSGKSLQVVLSNRGNLRVVELDKRLNTTQVDIFTKWQGAGSLSNQEALHTTLWESFKLKSVNQKFYDGVANSFNELLQHLKSIEKDEEEAKLFASRLLGRLLFCWFLRKKNIIDESIGYFDAQGADSTTYYKSNLERLFFLTLNTPVDERDELQKQHQQQLIHLPIENKQPSLFKTDQKTPYLNGGLFEPHDSDWFNDEDLTFPNGYFVNIYNHFEEFNFTTDESSTEYEQIAIDPEMLGRVFESLLATQIDETGKQARKAKGTFYTPREIVSFMCKESLRNYLYKTSDKSTVDKLLDTSDREWASAGTNSIRDAVPKDQRPIIINALDIMTVLDPACGSGAFPMGMLQLCMKLYERLDSRFDPYKTKLRIVQKNIYGIDIEPMAVEIARLRAWLSLIVDEENLIKVDTLPNLDFKFVCANSLLPLSTGSLFTKKDLHLELQKIRDKYWKADDKDVKSRLKKEYKRLVSPELLDTLDKSDRSIQLKSYWPFELTTPAVFFDSDQMFGIQDGFDVIIGNPPYVEHKKLKHISRQLKKEYEVYTGSSDLSVYFFEFAFNNLKKSGIVSYINTNKFFNTEYGGKLRKFLLNKNILKLVNFEQVPVFENVLVSSCVIICENESPVEATLDFKQLYKDKNWRDSFISMPFESYPYENLADTEWSFKSQSDISIKQKIESAANPIKDIEGIQIRRGVTTGFDPAFIINEDKMGDLENDGIVLKRLLKGEHIKRYSIKKTDLWLINSHNGVAKKNIKPINLPVDYPRIYQYLDAVDQKYDGAVRNRSDQGKDWFNLRNCAFLDEFDQPKIIWPLTADKWGFAYDDGGRYLASGSFMLTSRSVDIRFILGLLNSKLMNYYFSHTGVMTAGGAFTLKKSTIERMPLVVQKDTSDITKLVNSIISLKQEDENANTDEIEYEIDKLVYRLYGLTPEEIAIIEESVK